ncbi:MAG: peptidoglycan DD-metalloendopeptidase family protein [Flavobacteriales bacterium]|nr:peptidoglycan DD-metalloendopeptidase family protein [Flavobacteriales bacterium]
MFWACQKDGKTTNQQKGNKGKMAAESVDSIQTLYDFKINRFLDNIDTFEVARNSIFENMFDGYNTNDSLVFEAIGKTDSIFKINKIIAGNTVEMVYRNQHDGKYASHLIYHVSPVEKLILEFRDKSDAHIYKIKVDTVERTIASRIERTLYHSILDAQATYELGISLSEVFAWQVNFFKIDENDFFKVVFDEYQANGKVIGVGSIKAAMFYHRGDTFYAYKYINGEDSGYYDQNGESLKKAFLKAPLKYSRISSRYSKRRFHPVTKEWKAHLGTDYAAPTGTPIRTVGDGRIVAATFAKYNGNFVKVEHNKKYTTQYLHMSKIAKGIKVGKHVKQGDIIGFVGSTGLATGPHLCFRFWQNGVQIDPYSVISPRSTEVSSKHLADFKAVKKFWEDKFNQLPLPDKNAEKDLPEDDFIED